MLRPLLSALAAILPTSLIAFDFTPRSLEINTVDGGVHTVQYFENDGKYYVTSSRAVRLTGSPKQAVFSFTQLQGAEMRLQQCPILEKDGNPRIVSAARFEEAAKQFAPEGAKAVNMESKPCDELEAREIPAYEVISRYEVSGSAIWQSVLFLTLVEKEPMVMITTAYEEQADDARLSALRMIRAFTEVTRQELETPPMH